MHKHEIRGVTVVTPVPTPAISASRGQGALGTAGLVLVVITAIVGSNVNGIRDRLLGSVTPEPTTVVAARVAGAAATTTTMTAPTRLRSQPWWQQVGTLQGDGSTVAAPLTIDAGAVQWRVRSTCESGRLLVQDPRRPRPLLDQACPGSAEGYATTTGPVRLDVTASGPWEAQVEQQVDVPLVEPPLASMTAPGAAAIATGKLYRIDQQATGTVTLYRQADGSHALRLDDFFVSPNSLLEVRLSPLPAPTTTEEFLREPSELVMALDVTTGSLNVVLPPTLDPAKFGSVVIWCPTVTSAYGAATLERIP